ncbi:MAG TPA: DUF1330 domain-containing protein [Microlunatus sp.]
MPAYIVVRVGAITDPDRYNEYRTQTRALLTHYGARYLVKGYDEQVAEGGTPERFTIIEFPSLDTIHEFWNSQEYNRIRQIRVGAVDVKAGFVDGFTGAATPAR